MKVEKILTLFRAEAFGEKEGANYIITAAFILALSRDPGKIGNGTGFWCGTESGKGRDSITKSRNPDIEYPMQ